MWLPTEGERRLKSGTKTTWWTMESNSKGSEINQNSQKKIETAVKFLRNSRVKETPLSQRKAFLLKKGLSEDEIQKAIELSQTDQNEDIAPILRNPSHSFAVYPGQPQPYSLRWRDFLWIALVGGSFGYLLAHLVKTYVLPYILNQKDDSIEKIDELQMSVSELKENLSQTVSGIQDTLDSVQRLLQEQQHKVQSMSLTLSTSQACLSQSMTESYSLTEIKSELSSLKGLLLNRRQFPSPVVQSSPFPSIPAWQRNNTQSNDDNGATYGSDSAIDDNCLTTGKKVETSKDILQINTETKPDTSEDATECNGTEADTSSRTLELPSSPKQTRKTVGSRESDSNQYDSSFSTMSSEVGSPNLSLSEMKESLSDTYVKLSE